MLEPTRNSLALMQTVVMSFARGLYLGKAELPIDHVHIYFPVQVVHKVVEQCIALDLQDVTPRTATKSKFREACTKLSPKPFGPLSMTQGYSLPRPSSH